MNLQKIEDKIISYFEGEFDEVQKGNFLKEISVSNTATELFETYKLLYEGLNSEPYVQPSSALKDNFYATLNNKNTSAKERPILSIFPLLKYAAVGLILIITGALITLNWAKRQQIDILNGKMVALKSEMLQLLENESTAIRIKAVNLSSKLEQSDDAIINILIKTMNGDASENVRLAAVDALEKFAYDPNVKNAFLKALETQTDDFIQIKLIHILANIKEKSALLYLDKIIKDNDASKYLKKEASVGKEVIINL